MHNGLNCEVLLRQGCNRAATRLPPCRCSKDAHSARIGTSNTDFDSNLHGEVEDKIMESGENKNESTNKPFSTNGTRICTSENVIEALSAIGANLSIPEMTEKAQQRHKHHIGPGGGFPNMSMSEYVEAGVEFARMPVGGDIEGYRGQDGCIVRFNNITGEWVKAYSTGVASYMIPGRKRQYYLDWLNLDGGVTS